MQETKQAAAKRALSPPAMHIGADSQGRRSPKGLADPVNARAYGTAWLAQQCNRIAAAKAALLVIRFPGAAPLTIAWPIEGSDDPWLARLTDDAFAERKTVVALDQSGDGSSTGGDAPHGGTAIAVPLGIGDQPTAVVAMALATIPLSAHAHNLAGIAEELRWGAGWLEALPWVQRGKRHPRRPDEGAGLPRPAGGVGRSADTTGDRHGGHERAGSAVQLATARRLASASRTGSVRLLAISHSATFKSDARLVAAIESAMEEAVEQRATVTYPPQLTSGRVRVMAQCALAEQASNPGASVISFVLASGSGSVVGAITLERHAGPAFDQATLQMAEAVAALLGPVVAYMRGRAGWWPAA